MKGILRMLWAAAMKAALVWVAWRGVADGAVWAANLFEFVTVCALVVAFLLCLNAEEEPIQAKLAPGPALPAGLCLAIYFGLACFLAANGWFGYATMTAITGILEGVAYSRAVAVYNLNAEDAR